MIDDLKIYDTHVFVRAYPFDCDERINFKARLEEIERCKSEKVRNQKFFAWKLLEYAVSFVYNKDIADCEIYKDGDKWKCDDFYLSISHTNNVVAVAVSSSRVGIDIEKKDVARFDNIRADKFLSEEEKSMFPSLDGITKNKLWALKEAIFKFGNDRFFFPNRVSTLGINHAISEIFCASAEYFLAVVGAEEYKLHLLEC